MLKLLLCFFFLTGYVRVIAQFSEVCVGNVGNTCKSQIENCNDRSSDCSTMINGDIKFCYDNPGWMSLNCPLSCGWCNLVDPKVRCLRETLNMSNAPAYRAGTFETMFTNALEEFKDDFNINVLSSSPWIISFENFLSARDVEDVLGTVEGQWGDSTEPGAANEFGEASRSKTFTRTSSTAWCMGTCGNHPTVKRLLNTIEKIVRIPQNHYEHMQILRYTRGQRYHGHYDMSWSQAMLPSGPRILTFFLYLSDVEEGGETEFPMLGLKIKPAKGKAVLWVNTLDSNMNEQDSRTLHEAIEVSSGTKYSANVWIHLYDFETPHKWRCTGSE